MSRQNNLIWIDLEMTGLFPDQDSIIEIATIVTDADLNVVAQGPELAIHHSEAIMQGMDAWNTRQHGKSGLTQRVLDSQCSMARAEQATLDFLVIHSAKGASPMCGNSICQDRRFMARLMPTLESFFHYRNLDVSSIKELANRWRPDILPGFEKQGSHLALDDIKDSIAELRYYRKHFFRMDG